MAYWKNCFSTTLEIMMSVSDHIEREEFFISKVGWHDLDLVFLVLVLFDNLLLIHWWKWIYTEIKTEPDVTTLIIIVVTASGWELDF